MAVNSRTIIATLAGLAAAAMLAVAPSHADVGEDSDYGYAARGRIGPPLDLRRAPSPDQPRIVEQALAMRRAAETETPAATPISASAPEAPRRRPDWLSQETIEAPYEAEGVLYVPTAEPGYEQTGKASWYGAELAGRRTASGETFDPNALTGAHPTLPMPSLVQVTNLANGAEVIVRINDRGPFTGGRIIDVSQRAAQVLGFERAGEARVHVRYLGPAPRQLGRTAGGRAGPLAPPPTAPPDRQAGRTMQDRLFVQVGAFSNAANAERAQARLRDAGPVVIEVVERNGRPLHKVQVGPLGDQNQAARARDQAAAAGFGEAVVVRRAP